MSTNNFSEKETPIKSLILFFVLSFAISWLFNLPRVLSDNDLAIIPSFLLNLNSLATFGPFIAAFFLTFNSSGRDGLKALWRRGWDFSFNKKWLWVVLLFPVLTSTLTILFVNVFGGEILWEHQPLPFFLAVPIFFVIFLTQGLPEEFGWRGFALDRLQIKWNALTASLILGFFWGLWHLPLHFMSGTTQEIIPIYQFILKQMVGAIFFTWIYNNTNRNIFLAILFHSVSNVFGGLVPYWVTNQGRWVNFSIELILAILVIIIYGANKFIKEDS